MKVYIYYRATYIYYRLTYIYCRANCFVPYGSSYKVTIQTDDHGDSPALSTVIGGDPSVYYCGR